MNRHPEVVKALMRRPEIDLNTHDIIGHTPLYWAPANGSAEIVLCLLQHKELDPNFPADWRETPLAAVASGQARSN